MRVLIASGLAVLFGAGVLALAAPAQAKDVPTVAGRLGRRRFLRR